MGKWSHLVGQYPERREASATIKAEYTGKSAKDLEEIASQLYDDKKRLEKEFGVAKMHYEAVSEVLLDIWKESKVTGCRRDGIGTLSRTDDIYARVTNMTEFKESVKEKGLDNLVQEVVNAQSLSASIKQLMLDGEELPEGISIFTKSKVKITKPKQKGE